MIFQAKPKSSSWLTVDPEEFDVPDDATVYAFPHHEIHVVDGEFKQTRSGPNWQGDILTLTTCKQFMRTWREDWNGVWFAGFMRGQLVWCGEVGKTFESNYDLGRYMQMRHKRAWKLKQADDSPFGDIYTPTRVLEGGQRYDIEFFSEPPNHTRSTEFYPDGTPKWWKDIRYSANGKYPRCLLFHHGYVWTQPTYDTSLSMGRSGCKVSGAELIRSLS